MRQRSIPNFVAPSELRDRENRPELYNKEVWELAAKIGGFPPFIRRRFLRTPPNHYPRFIYKYRGSDVDRLGQIVVDNALWLSSPTDFNDPFDTAAQYVFDGTIRQKLSAIDKLLKDNTKLTYKQRVERAPKLVRSHNWALYFQNAYDQNIERTGVCSFSEDPRNILMWSHYAESHKGFCVQYTVSEGLELFLRAFSVRYLSRYLAANPVTESRQEILKRALLNKAVDWSYEKERRIIAPGDARSLMPVPVKALSAVIIGCRANSHASEAVHELAKKRMERGLPGFKIYYAQKDGREIRLRIRKRKPK